MEWRKIWEGVTGDHGPKRVGVYLPLCGVAVSSHEIASPMEEPNRKAVAGSVGCASRKWSSLQRDHRQSPLISAH